MAEQARIAAEQATTTGVGETVRPRDQLADLTNMLRAAHQQRQEAETVAAVAAALLREQTRCTLG